MRPLYLALAILFALPALAEPAPAKEGSNVIRIGVLTDLSGSLANAAGRGSIEAAEMAVEDASRGFDRPITIVTADYQSRSDLAQHISEDWLKRQNVDMVVDVPNPVIAARLQELFRSQGKLLLSSTPRRLDDAAGDCGANGLFWLYDRETLSTNVIRALLTEGKQRWFILGGDTVYATNLANSIKAFIQKSGGAIVGEAYLGPRLTGLAVVAKQIRAANPDITMLALERPDVLHVLRHWPDVEDGKKMPPLAVSSLHLSDVLDSKERPLPPFYMAASFYWNQDPGTRVFSDRFAQRNHGVMPSSIHASVYSAVYHYLRSVRATGRTDADTVLAHMKTQMLQDGFFQGSRIRSDGVVMHPVQLLHLKEPSLREGPFDLFRVARTLNISDEIAPPMANCPAATVR